MSLHWSAEFVGLPWRERGRDRTGVDCWGLLFLIYASRGVEVQSYADDYVSVDERERVAAIATQAASESEWLQINPGEEREFDALLFKRAGLATHVGIVVAPGKMLHIRNGGMSEIVPWRSRLIGIYRHRGL
jgi:cell wall-associated NlpC family hydrolase